MKILVIDDNEDITEMVSLCLNAYTHNCMVSNDGRAGLSLIEKEKFDVVFLDLSMPKFSGYDVLDSLEKNGKIKDQKIIILTAKTISTDEIKTLEKRAFSVLLKPVGPDEILRSLE